MGATAVVFDIGNVLIEWAPERVYDARIGADARRALFAEVDLAGMNDRIDLGAPLGATVAETAARHPRWAEAIALWDRSWIDMATPEIPGSVALLRALRRRGVPTYALTNFGAETLARAEARYPFLREFDARIVSAELGIAKPDAEIYAALERATGHPPGALLFTDERPENVAAARARGWQAHLFEGPEGWGARLVAAGLLPAEEAA